MRGNEKIDFFGTEKIDSASGLSQLKYKKIDLNNDGLTDLIVNGTYLFAVIDDGKGGFNVDFIDRGTFMLDKYVLFAIDTLEKQPKIIVERYNQYNKSPVNRNVYDTLVLKFNGFVEFTNHQETFGIEKIDASTTMCFGSCPVFELSINADGTAIYKALNYNEKKGNFEGEVDTETLNELFGLVNYIRARSLRNDYKVNWTDDQTINITITYKDGTVKSISDYGEIGTFGLQRLYEHLFKLRTSQKWQPM